MQRIHLKKRLNLSKFAFTNKGCQISIFFKYLNKIARFHSFEKSRALNSTTLKIVLPLLRVVVHFYMEGNFQVCHYFHFSFTLVRYISQVLQLRYFKLSYGSKRYDCKSILKVKMYLNQGFSQRTETQCQKLDESNAK